MYYVGIDIAKRFYEAAVIDENKVIVKRIKFQNSHYDAVRKFNQPVELNFADNLYRSI